MTITINDLNLVAKLIVNSKYTKDIEKDLIQICENAEKVKTVKKDNEKTLSDDKFLKNFLYISSNIIKGKAYILRPYNAMGFSTNENCITFSLNEITYSKEDDVYKIGKRIYLSSLDHKSDQEIEVINSGLSGMDNKEIDNNGRELIKVKIKNKDDETYNVLCFSPKEMYRTGTIINKDELPDDMGEILDKEFANEQGGELK